MAQFCPQGFCPNNIAYSPYVTPNNIGGNKCLIVDERLKDVEPRAWKFVNDFANDNTLQTELREVAE